MNTEDNMEPSSMDLMKRQLEFVDRTTRIVRLLTWTVLLAVGLLVLGILMVFVTAPTWADDPKALAREVGRAGLRAAGAIAKDAGKAATVPGYAGTELTEAGLEHAGMADAARRTLADPQAPGGAAGRTVIEGAASRLPSPVSKNDPVVGRTETIAADPHAPNLGADDLASGSLSDCTAGLGAAEDGGACGGVTYCVGAGCETVRPQANSGFARSAAMLNMVMEMGSDEFDRGNLRFFNGDRQACRIKLGGLANCCKDSGLLTGIAGCTQEEHLLAEERHAGNTHYLGKECTKKVLGICVRHERAWCVFGSKLGRILHEQARPQLAMDWEDCRGFTVAEIGRIDFDRVDLSEFTENLMDEAKAPGISLPHAGETGTAMSGRILDFYERNN